MRRTEGSGGAGRTPSLGRFPPLLRDAAGAASARPRSALQRNPAPAPEGLFYPCAFPCLEDRDCLGAQKCCPLRCGVACLEPLQGKGSPEPAGSAAPGARLPANRDVDPGRTWATARGWGPPEAHGSRSRVLMPRACRAPPNRPKPGECPAAQPGLAGTCRERCRGGSDCPDAQKCCNSSCGRQCLPAAPAGETAWDRMGRAVAWGRGVMPWGRGHPRAQSCGTTRATSLRARRGGLCGGCRGRQECCCLSQTSHCCPQ